MDLLQRASCHRFRAVIVLAGAVGGCGDAPREPGGGGAKGASRGEGGMPKREAPASRALPPRDGPSPVKFVDATAEAGLHFAHDNGFHDQQWRIVETLGSGLVFLDADRDGDQDLYLLTGCSLLAPPTAASPRNAFFRNDGRGRFTDVTDEAGLADGRYSLGGCAADYDNDGDVDLYVAHFDEGNSLWRNDGQGRFEDVAAEAGVLGRPDSADGVCAFADVDRDGWLDLFVGAYAEATRAPGRACWDSPPDDPSKKERRYCPPTEHAALPDLLFRGGPDGKFVDVTATSGVGRVRARTLGALFCDYDNDGDPDLIGAGDRTPNFLLVNDGKGHFTDNALAAGIAFDADGRAQAGMGITAGDLDNDGRFDLGFTYFERESFGLLQQQANGRFRDIAGSSGTASETFLALGWGTEFFDADLDGRLDWLMVNGHLQPGVERFRRPGTTAGYEQLPLFFLNRGDLLFESLAAEAGPAIAERYVGRALATADVDADGDLDVVFTNNRGPAILLRNDSPRAGRHWFAVTTRGTKSNRDGIGARVTLEAGGVRQIREIHTAGSYFSQGELSAHFGLGSADRVATLEVRWPSGAMSRLQDLPADQRIEVVEPE